MPPGTGFPFRRLLRLAGLRLHRGSLDTDRVENTIPLLFTDRCLVTAGCYDSTVLALSEYATILCHVDPLLGNDFETKNEITSAAR
jgi:hypothetical protein